MVSMLLFVSVCVAPGVCWPLTHCKAPLIPLLAASTVPAIKFPSQRSLTNYSQQMQHISNANNTTVRSNSAGSQSLAWWISCCQSTWNWICTRMLCQLFLRIHLTDKTVIKLMQRSPQNGLAMRVEMKHFFPFWPTERNPTSLNGNISHEWYWRAPDKARAEQLVCTRMRMKRFSNTNHPRTSPWNIKSNVNLSILMHICIFSCSGLSVASSGWRWSTQSLQRPLSWATHLLR